MNLQTLLSHWDLTSYLIGLVIGALVVRSLRQSPQRNIAQILVYLQSHSSFTIDELSEHLKKNGVPATKPQLRTAASFLERNQLLKLETLPDSSLRNRDQTLRFHKVG